MATSNAEILEQLEKLAKHQNLGPGWSASEMFPDFSVILAAVKRLVKIEEAARVVDELTRGGFPKLAAALKEKANGQ